MKNNLKEIKYDPIGIIHTPFKTPIGTPIQSTAAEEIEGQIEIFNEFVDGLKDLNGFSHIILIFHFHLIKGAKLRVKPYMDNNLRGVFATRAPMRPNPIGISIVKLIKIEDNIIYIKDIDIVDKTPLLDIKPFVPQFDKRNVIKIGWLDKNVDKLKHSKDDGRFIK